nr:MAG TPA: hypothetical protein [Caudoviricetes sp.]
MPLLQDRQRLPAHCVRGGAGGRSGGQLDAVP